MDMKHFGKTCAGVLISALILTACGTDSTDKTIVNRNAFDQAESINYMEESFDVPFDFTSFDLDHVTEDSIGLLTNPDGSGGMVYDQPVCERKIS